MEVINNSNSIKLHKLIVNKFYGDSSRWLEFINQSQNAMNKNNNLSKIEKLIYLKRFLEGSPAKTISGFALSENNYDAALDLLKKCFGQTNLLINTHLGSLLNIPPVKNSNDTFGLENCWILPKQKLEISRH